jgi:hypothetical protein
MRVDWQTLHDLGILQPEGHQASLYEWADCTCTAGGAQLLRERFRQPLSDITELRATQEAVVWISEHTDLFSSLLGGSAWRSMDRYTESSIVALEYPNRVFLWLDSWWVRYLNADLYREVAAALALAQTLVRYAAAILESVQAELLPPMLRAWHARLADCLGTPALEQLRTGGDVHRLRPPRVREGVSEQRLGMLILEREGVLGRLSTLASPAVQVSAAGNPP